MKNGRVLLADSHLGVLGGAHGRLNSLFETVLMVADERSLMETIVAFKPDLVVVDLSLPGGREVNISRHLMERHPDLRLIVLSIPRRTDSRYANPAHRSCGFRTQAHSSHGPCAGRPGSSPRRGVRISGRCSQSRQGRGPVRPFAF